MENMRAKLKEAINTHVRFRVAEEIITYIKSYSFLKNVKNNLKKDLEYDIKREIRDYIEGESFIDEIIQRIKRKQLK